MTQIRHTTRKQSTPGPARKNRYFRHFQQRNTTPDKPWYVPKTPCLELPLRALVLLQELALRPLVLTRAASMGACSEKRMFFHPRAVNDGRQSPASGPCCGQKESGRPISTRAKRAQHAQVRGHLKAHHTTTRIRAQELGLQDGQLGDSM